METSTALMASIQFTPAQPECMYSDVTARCACGSTIRLRTDDYWTHGAVQGIYCREEA